jgi:uncharacterized membrane protein YoaK (UPF0700 family)
LWVWSEQAHGPLPVLLVLLCLVTGFVDATCYIALGRVFVANMTGNVVLLGFAIGGAPGLSASGSLAALGAFVVGSILGGRIAHHYQAHRGRHMSVGAASAGVPLALALVAAIAIGEPIGAGARFALITPLGIAMGIQNATARRLAVPDLSTTVVTNTITGLFADLRLAGGHEPRRTALRRLISVLAIFAGAIVGALLVVQVSVTSALAGAVALMATTWLVARTHTRDEAEWTRPSGAGPPPSAAARAVRS